MTSILRVDQILNTSGDSEITLGKVNHTDTTDTTVPSAASIYTPGGIATLKDLSVGTSATVGTDLTVGTTLNVTTSITTPIITVNSDTLDGKATSAAIITSSNDTKFITPLGGLILAPVGSVQMFVSTTAPTGWLYCNGATIGLDTGTYQGTDYQALFNLIRTITGWGNASEAWGTGTTVRIPDLRGMFVRGADANAYADAGSAADDANSAAFTGGTLGTYEDDKMQGHKHNSYANNLNYMNLNNSSQQVMRANTVMDYPISTPITDGANGSPRTGNETQPANVSLAYIIKY